MVELICIQIYDYQALFFALMESCLGSNLFLSLEICSLPLSIDIYLRSGLDSVISNKVRDLQYPGFIGKENLSTLPCLLSHRYLYRNM